MTNPVHPVFRIAVRAVAAAAFFAALGMLVSRALVPDGRLSVTTDFVNPAPYVSMPKPSERLAPPERAADGTPRTPLLGDPVFVDFSPPSRFDSVTVTLSYENAAHPAVEVGALASALDQQYDVRPVENRVVDQLPWKRMTSGTLTLLDRRDRYASVDEFLRNPPPRDRVATYAAAAPLPYRIEGYRPASGTRDIEVSLRGHHRMLTYVKDEPLNVTFTVQDMNRQHGADPVTVSVYFEDGAEPVARTVLADDGNVRDDQKSSKLRQVPVSLVAPEEGTYKIEFTSSADVFIRKITTRQRKFVFVDKLYLGDHVGYSDRTPAITVLTDGMRLVARTPHAEALQTLTVAGKRLALEQPNLRYIRQVGGVGLSAITSPKRSVLLETDGLFALSNDEYFDPLTLPIEWYVTQADLEARGIEYVLANYEAPREERGVKSGTVTFDMRRLAKTEEGAYRFVVSATGIGETRQPLRLASMTFALRRQPVTLWNALPRLLAAFRPQEEKPAEVISDGMTFGEDPK